MNDYFLYYQYFVTFLLALFLCFTVYNLAGFAKIRRRKISAEDLSPGHIPFVSLLVPARNEEKNIRACVESLCRQDYPHFEVIALDDHSTDATGEILAELAAQYPGRLRIISGRELPEGWVGKNWACHRLSQEAKGEFLIFTDADTVHDPLMLSSCMIHCRGNGYEFLSIIPYEIMISPGEQLVLPLIHFMFFAYLPYRIIQERKEFNYAAGNGQFMLFRRDAYDRIGGHYAVRNNLVEDVFLSRRAKMAGLRMALADGTEIVSCRMYENSGEVFRGFSKNFFPAMSYSLGLLILLLSQYALLYIAPPVLMIISFITKEFSLSLFWLSLVQYLLVVSIKLMIALRFRMPKLQAFLQPLSVAFAIAIGINSARWAYSKKGASWKGRHYPKRLITD